MSDKFHGVTILVGEAPLGNPIETCTPALQAKIVMKRLVGQYNTD